MTLPQVSVDAGYQLLRGVAYPVCKKEVVVEVEAGSRREPHMRENGWMDWMHVVLFGYRTGLLLTVCDWGLGWLVREAAAAQNDLPSFAWRGGGGWDASMLLVSLRASLLSLSSFLIDWPASMYGLRHQSVRVSSARYLCSPNQPTSTPRPRTHYLAPAQLQGGRSGEF